MSGEWLSLGEAAELLGIHPSTVRSWSDGGYLPVRRTRGGHRRFRRSDLELWIQSQRSGDPSPQVALLVKNALKRTRLQIGEGRLEQESWYRKLDEAAREQYRKGSRTLMHGLVGYLTTDGEAAEAEAHAIGYEYATIGRRCGLSSVDTAHAFLFFRNLLLDSMVNVFEAAAIHSPQVWGDMLRKINGFTDQVMVSLLETYEAFRGTK